jgi:hypothetical protein
MEISQTKKKADERQVRVTNQEIAQVKRDHIERNLCYSLREAGAMFGKGEKWALERVKDGEFVAVDDRVKQEKNGHGLILSQGIRVTATSIEIFRQKYEIDAEKLAG